MNSEFRFQNLWSDFQLGLFCVVKVFTLETKRKTIIIFKSTHHRPPSHVGCIVFEFVVWWVVRFNRWYHDRIAFSSTSLVSVGDYWISIQSVMKCLGFSVMKCLGFSNESSPPNRWWRLVAVALTRIVWLDGALPTAVECVRLKFCRILNTVIVRIQKSHSVELSKSSILSWES